MASRLLRTWFLVLLGLSLGSPPLRTVQPAAERTALAGRSPSFHRKPSRARTGNPRIATPPSGPTKSADVGSGGALLPAGSDCGSRPAGLAALSARALTFSDSF